MRRSGSLTNATVATTPHVVGPMLLGDLAQRTLSEHAGTKSEYALCVRLCPRIFAHVLLKGLIAQHAACDKNDIA